MTLRKADFSVTLGAGGLGYDDVHLRSSVRDRGARVERVVFDRTDGNDGDPHMVNLTVSELDDVSDETWNDSAETYALGRQLVFIPRGAANTDSRLDEFVPRVSVVTAVGASPTTDVMDARPFIETADIRVEVTGGVEGDVYTGTVYYETAGDYRF